MSLTVADHKAMMRGFVDSGFRCKQAPQAATNPMRVELHLPGETLRFKLWVFEITHGGGDRQATEFRIQITNGPPTTADFDIGNAEDLLFGYSPDLDVIVAYDRRWLEKWSQKSGGSPSVQVREKDMLAAQAEGIHHLTKGAAFGDADIVTMTATFLPTYLLNHKTALVGKVQSTYEDERMPKQPDSVFDYCCDRGIYFDPDLIARYIASALTKPFVILAGVSGTGKSKLAELVAEFYSIRMTSVVASQAGLQPSAGDSYVFVDTTPDIDHDRFALVAVRPDWIDNQSVFGFLNPITERYESTQALDLLLRAAKALAAAADKADAPRYFMLLDEMNLARVEHYFSDWLACTESRRYGPAHSVTQQPVPLHRFGGALETVVQHADRTTERYEVPDSLELPTNLIVTGTVNVDETTYGFSPKVLDRSMVLEFDDVDLGGLWTLGSDLSLRGYKLPHHLAPFRLPTAEDYSRLPEAVHRHLVAINEILKEARLHFGYRTANEMALFMSFYKEMLPLEEDPAWVFALDAAILQKVLPRLSGNRAKVERMLVRLCAYFASFSEATVDGASMSYKATGDAALPRAYARATEMLAGLREFGFISFFR